MQQDNNTMLIFVVIAAWFAYTFYTRSKRRTAVSRKLMESPKIIDVRDPEEFAKGGYPGAVNIPLDRLTTELAEYDAKSKPVIVYCSSGARSKRAQRILRSIGFSDVTDGGSLGNMPR